jgi:hypothetical protein
MPDFYLAILFGIVNIVVPYLITRFDRRRIGPEMLERAWNGPSWACAVYFFGPLCLPAHFWVTRRTARGFLYGVGWTIGIVAGESLIAEALERMFGS